MVVLYLENYRKQVNDQFTSLNFESSMPSTVCNENFMRDQQGNYLRLILGVEGNVIVEITGPRI